MGKSRRIPFNLWCMSHTYDVLEARTYDEVGGPGGPHRAPRVMYRKSEFERISKGEDRTGNKVFSVEVSDAEET